MASRFLIEILLVIFLILLLTFVLQLTWLAGPSQKISNVTTTSESQAPTIPGTVTEYTADSLSSGTYSYDGQDGFIWNFNSTWNYYVYLPANFNSSKTYALVIGFHGDDGSAEAFEQSWENDANTYNFILAFPQSPTGDWYIPVGTAMDKYIISTIKSKYQINDVFLTGCSAGAKVIIYDALLNPGVFRGIGSVVGDIDFGSYNPGTYTFDNASGQHFYMINGALDTTVNPNYVKQTIANLTAGGGIVIAKEYNMGHECPTYAFDNLSAWFASLE